MAGRTENIHETHAHIVRRANAVNVNDVIATLTVPAGRVFRINEGIPLLLKLFTSAGVEISRASKVFLAWQEPVGEAFHQAGTTMNYGIFRRISVAEQANIQTQARRVIEFDDEERARAERGDVSIISGLPSDHKVLLMLNSPDVVDWTQPGSEFNFDMNLLTEEEFRAERGLPVV